MPIYSVSVLIQKADGTIRHSAGWTSGADQDTAARNACILVTKEFGTEQEYKANIELFPLPDAMLEMIKEEYALKDPLDFWRAQMEGIDIDV